MEKQVFIDKTPFLYHLTDERNLLFIKNQKRLFSTTELVALSTISEKEAFVVSRRAQHTEINIQGNSIWIRDQRPLNKALDNCLTDGWTRDDFIAHLNKRVFMWPNLKRLAIHYSRYQSEKPVIMRFKTSEILELNSNNVELSNINSGATRPSGRLAGKAAARGKDTFLNLDNCNYPVQKVAEVTFPNFCILPATMEIGMNPNGDWNSFNF